MVGGTRHAVVTDDDHGAILAMTTWFLACALVLCSAMRIGVRCSTKHLPTLDDWLILVAATLAIGSTVAISLAVNSGLGKRNALLQNVNIEQIQRSTYAATIFYVLTVGVSKLSITTFLSRLACTSRHKNARILLCALVVCWTVAITIGVVFECELPRPWQVLTGRCIRMFPFWLSASIVDIVSDISMIVLPIHIVSGLQLPARKKAIVMSIFALRLILIAIAAIRLFYLHYFLDGSDPSFHSIPYFTLTQAHATFSVIIACSPALKPFMNSVRTGMLSISLAKHCPNTYYGQGSYHTQALTKTSSTSKSKGNSDTSGQRSDDSETLVQFEASHTAQPQFVYVSNEQAKIAAQRYARQALLPTALSDITLTPTKRLSRCPAALPTSVSSKTKARTPVRPPPPPEELRPDLSLFVSPQVGSRCVVGGSAGSGGSERPHVKNVWSGEGGSEENVSSRKGTITKTQGWDIRYDDYHFV